MRRASVVAVALALSSLAGRARADETADAIQALSQNQPSEAIRGFEALADRGVLDANVSFDRGLAYAARVRKGNGEPGDLGRAAHGFEEARSLGEGTAVADDAARALTIVRSEVARRTSRSGDPVELEHGASLGRSIALLLSEDVWCVLAAVASLALAVGMLVRAFSRGADHSARRAFIGGSIACAIAAPLLVLCAGMALVRRHDRLARREAVVVVASARPVDERGIVLPSGKPVPEAALVQIVDERAGLARVRWGSIDAWVPATSLRAVAKPD